MTNSKRQIAADRVLRLNCPGFGEENHLNIGRAKPLDNYQAIIANPVSLLHLFDKGPEPTRRINQLLEEGVNQLNVPDDALIQELINESDARLEELIPFLSQGGLLVYFLCRPFVLAGPSISVDNYDWLSVYAPAQKNPPDNGSRQMSALSHGRLIEPTEEGSSTDCEFAQYFQQTGLEWNTIIRTDFLSSNYSVLAQAGAKKCISAQFWAGDNGGKVVFLPAPYSPDFDRLLMDGVNRWYNDAIDKGYIQHQEVPNIAKPDGPAFYMASTADNQDTATQKASTMQDLSKPEQDTASNENDNASLDKQEGRTAPKGALKSLFSSDAMDDDEEFGMPIPDTQAQAQQEPLPAATSNIPVRVTAEDILRSVSQEVGVDLDLGQAPPASAPEPELARINNYELKKATAEMDLSQFAETARQLVQQANQIETATRQDATPAPSMPEPAAFAPDVQQTQAEAPSAPVIPQPLTSISQPQMPKVDNYKPAFSESGNAQTSGLAPEVAQPLVSHAAPLAMPAESSQPPQTEGKTSRISDILKGLEFAKPGLSDLEAAQNENEPPVSPNFIHSDVADVAENAHIAPPSAAPAFNAAEQLVNQIEQSMSMATDKFDETQTQESIPALQLASEIIQPAYQGELLGLDMQEPEQQPEQAISVAPQSQLQEPEVAVDISSDHDLDLAAAPAPQSQPQQMAASTTDTAPMPVPQSAPMPALNMSHFEPVQPKQPQELIKKMEEFANHTHAWTSNFSFSYADGMKLEFTQMSEQVRQMQAHLSMLENKINTLESLKTRLLSSEQEGLMAAAQEVFIRLGYQVQPSRTNPNELWLSRGDQMEAIARMVRSQGAANRTEVAQLAESVISFWDEFEVEPKGILIAQTFFDKHPHERQEADFSSAVQDFSSKKHLCILSSMQLLAMFKDAETNSMSTDDMRRKLLDTNGKLLGFSLEANLQTPATV